MNKAEFVDHLAKKTNMSKKDAREALDAALDLIVDTCAKNDKVTFTGFGTFEPRKQKATQRINPQTGKQMKVPAKTVPKFRPGKGFKDAL
ncbi:MAG: HU family DNA-binding protein [Candidatus Bipolaricaulia bacterium]